MNADYRVRIQIKLSLENKYNQNGHQPFAALLAFQVAFCYQIGFGVRSDDDECRKWLEKSNKQPNDLTIEKEAVRPANGKRGRLSSLSGMVSVDLIHEYRTWGLKKLEAARKEYEREVQDMAQAFGELHIIPLGLYTTIGELLDVLGEFAKSKVLRMRIRDQIEKNEGTGHPYYIQSVIDIVQSHIALGEWVEAQSLLEEVHKHTESIDP